MEDEFRPANRPEWTNDVPNEVVAPAPAVVATPVVTAAPTSTAVVTATVGLIDETNRIERNVGPLKRSRRRRSVSSDFSDDDDDIQHIDNTELGIISSDTPSSK